MTEYRTIRTNIPPVIAIEDGEVVIKLIVGATTYVAGIGDGSYFFGQVVAKIVDPALRSAYARPEFASPNY